MHEQEASMQSVNIFGTVDLITLCIRNFEYSLALKSMKTLVLYCVRHPICLSMSLVFPKTIFSSKDHKKLIKTMLHFFFAFVRFISSM